MRPRSSPAPANRLARALLVALALALAPGCGGVPGRPLTADEIDEHGTATFDAPPGRVLPAVIDALRVLGYEIDAVREDRGLVVTKPVLGREVSLGAKTGPTARRYTVVVRGGEFGPSRVVVKPEVFLDGADISSQPVWDLQSPKGERALWKQLFQLVGSQL